MSKVVKSHMWEPVLFDLFFKNPSYGVWTERCPNFIFKDIIIDVITVSIIQLVCFLFFL